MALMHPPVIMGHENAGVISEVGEGVTDFKVGGMCRYLPNWTFWNGSRICL